MARKGWVLWTIVGFVVAAVGGVTVWVGLDAADKVGSVVGAACGLLGLMLSVYGMVQARRPTGPGVSPHTQHYNTQHNTAGPDGTVIAPQGGKIVFRTTVVTPNNIRVRPRWKIRLGYVLVVMGVVAAILGPQYGESPWMKLFATVFSILLSFWVFRAYLRRIRRR